MNLRCLAFAILAFNACHMPLVYADKDHHHHHHHREDYHKLAKSERPELIDIIYSKSDENHALKKQVEDLKNGLIPHRNEIIMYSMAAGAALAVGIGAFIKIKFFC